MSLDAPQPVKRKPTYCELRAGKTYLWCACGQSTTAPFCDGNSHKGTGRTPLRYKAKADEEVLFCECKQTSTPPFCDGTHSNLLGGYGEAATQASPDSVPRIANDERGFARLDGQCYVVSPDAVPPAWQSELCRIRNLVTRDLGSAHQSQFHVQLDSGQSPLLSADGDTIVWIASGKGRAVIGDTVVDIGSIGGLHIREGQSFGFEGEGISAYVSACPAVEGLRIDDAPWQADGLEPADTMRTVDEEARVAMGPRYFQVLMDDRDGLDNSAQFIGHIPPSRAEMHRHLYEEALIIVSGEGMIWNETRRAAVKAGDVIFFPRKAVHSLECVSLEGMDVVGFIHPGTNPGINY